MKKEARPGDVIKAHGITVTIGRILYQDFWDRFGWDIELIDTNGNYRHWKQWDDGGELIQQKKKLVNSYGSDCTDLFEKYGML